MKLRAYAKVNLTLKVLGSRADGYHELSSLVAPISLYDEIELFDRDDSKVTTNLHFKDDLSVKAANVLKARFPEISSRGVDIKVTKSIPEGGGLGGGSADAAAVLRGLNKLWNLGKTPEELSELGALVGSDVPALILAQHYKRVVLMQGRGEKVELYERPLKLKTKNIILVNPKVRSVTREVFSNFKPDGKAKCNYLEDSAMQLYPKIAEAYSFLKSEKVFGVRMSGSGSTIFGFSEENISQKHNEYDIIYAQVLTDCPVV